MTPEEKLKELGFDLPEKSNPLGAYLPVVRGSGGLLFVSGQLPLKDGALISEGRVGEGVGLEEAQRAAEQCVINALAVLRAELGSLERISRCLRLGGFVSSAQDFFEQPRVLNAASELLFNVFGERGRHARAAVGVSALPLNAPVEIEFLFEVEE